MSHNTAFSCIKFPNSSSYMSKKTRKIVEIGLGFRTAELVVRFKEHNNQQSFAYFCIIGIKSVFDIGGSYNYIQSITNIYPSYYHQAYN